MHELLEAIVHRPPRARKRPAKALLVDAWYDAYLGVVVLVRIIDGRMRPGQRVKLMNAGAVYGVDNLGVFRPKPTDAESLGPGEIGFFTPKLRKSRTPQSATPSPMNADRRRWPCRVFGRCSRWSFAGSFRWTPPSLRICERRSGACV